jgi:hypothetical protein
MLAASYKKQLGISHDAGLDRTPHGRVVVETLGRAWPESGRPISQLVADAARCRSTELVNAYVECFNGDLWNGMSQRAMFSGA